LEEEKKSSTSLRRSFQFCSEQSAKAIGYNLLIIIIIIIIIIINLNINRGLIIYYENIFKICHFHNKLKNTILFQVFLKYTQKVTFLTLDHKHNGSQLGINSHAKSIFHKFVWNGHRCHSFTYVIWTSMSCTLFKHKCHMPIFNIYVVCLFVLFTHKNYAHDFYV